MVAVETVETSLSPKSKKRNTPEARRVFQRILFFEPAVVADADEYSTAFIEVLNSLYRLLLGRGLK